MASTEQWKVGDVTISKVVETEDWHPLPFFAMLLPGASPEQIEALDWLRPSHLRDGRMSLSVHSYLIETPERKLVVDTGIGNAKPRAVETFSMLDTPFLERFAEVWPIEAVDGVICTHLHIDHVGWNTTLVDGAWVPTFPNARYYFVQAEYDYWAAYARTAPGSPDGFSDMARAMMDARTVFADSVAPVAEAGLATYVEATEQIDPWVRLAPTHGHTPGHVSVVVESGGERAVIAGDVMHAPCQVSHPQWSPILDSDPEDAEHGRRAFLAEHADTGTLVLGTHFGTPSGFQVTRSGDSFRMLPVVPVAPEVAG